MKNPFRCDREHIEEYVTSEDRVARLKRLRDNVMAQWEGALMWGEGNYFSRVYVPMITGLVDVASLAERLAEHPGNAELQADLRRRLGAYFKDLDTAKRAEAWEQERRDEEARRRSAASSQSADAAATLRDNAVVR